jgi:hypothetical protein
MQVIKTERVISVGSYGDTDEWLAIRKALKQAVEKVDWPLGSGTFSINPVKNGNGVGPIRLRFQEIITSEEFGWKRWFGEVPPTIRKRWRLGELDAVLETPAGVVAVEWETGNISSSHRALHKLVMGLQEGALLAGVLIVPSANLKPYLTDRVGNYPELITYLRSWATMPCPSGLLEVMVMEQDATDPSVPLIPKGNAGNAKRARRK